ncbi:sulfite oxidase heme-binding subunit YedZ [Hydromonas duriensis]|uniref:Protein-methionine-sulfoxide reductase heme-binding subunit MsrQ n=1 Tax=Hydromonas duriensis TaxID=1527608 RepID=A0A4R6YB62_9BURK|nr:protein-methionine-sulfoxide reductase heme-binding subunit MsrQ [Hydromonas duriensis]TDR32808.1 sulfoxide reductase heme-binding subunit YedZ [Hydromonas duriensis]
MRTDKKDLQLNKFLVFMNALVPLALVAWDGFRHQLGVNPVEFLIRYFGVMALVFVLVTLTITPLRKIFGWGFLIKYRRMLGLFAFFYACLHLIAYLGFDRGWSLSSTLADVIKRPFITIGMASFLMLVPLAITSTDRMLHRLGAKRWLKLHKLVYVLAIGGVVHFYMIVKSDVFWPLVFAFILMILLGYRLYARQQKNTPKPKTQPKKTA